MRQLPDASRLVITMWRDPSGETVRTVARSDNPTLRLYIDMRGVSGNQSTYPLCCPVGAKAYILDGQEVEAELGPGWLYAEGFIIEEEAEEK